MRRQRSLGLAELPAPRLNLGTVDAPGREASPDDLCLVTILSHSRESRHPARPGQPEMME